VASSKSGCACTLRGRAPSGDAGALSAVALAALVLRRRRRHSLYSRFTRLHGGAEFGAPEGFLAAWRRGLPDGLRGFGARGDGPGVGQACRPMAIRLFAMPAQKAQRATPFAPR
jgi:MYXO-CTERM domain-containing protein